MNDKKEPPAVALAVPDYQNDSAIGETAGWVSVGPRHSLGVSSLVPSTSQVRIEYSMRGATVNQSWVVGLE